MSQFVNTPTRTFTAGAAIAQYLRVKLSSGKLAVAVAGVTDEPVELGVIRDASFADLDVRAVLLRSSGGTTPMVADGAISQGVAVYGAAGGKVSSTASGNAIGIALEAAGADNDIIEVLRY